MSELHLIVLWEFARKAEERILSDVVRHVRIVASFTQRWPGDPREGYARFYGAKASLAAGKVESCGGGEFRVLIVRDEHPRYSWKKTSRGTEAVNVRLFAMKQRYRRWTGAHCVHSSNSPAEAERDIYLLTGRTVSAWETNASTEGLTLFPAGSDALSDPGVAVREAPVPDAGLAKEAKELCAAVFPVGDLRFDGEVPRLAGTSFRELVFAGTAPGAVPCSVHYCMFGRESAVTDWDFGLAFARRLPQHALRPLFFRMDENGERFGVAVRARVPGRTLRAALRDGLTSAQATEVARELVLIVETLVELDICHRNITPDSLVLGDDGHVRLADFDFAVGLKSDTEPKWLSRDFAALAALGGGYRIDAGRWCDALAASKCVEQLPDFPSKADALARLAASSVCRVHRVRLRHRFVRTALLAFLRLAFGNLIRRVKGKLPKTPAEQTLLGHALGLPVCGDDGWRDLRSVFGALEEKVRFVVLRNSEMLPDAFDPSLHGDIDFLVEDETAAARALGARKVICKPGRVHYEIVVAGRPVRLDLRHVGDGYYCETWERDILRNRRRSPGGVWIPSALDGFHSLAYHALFQKRAIAADYPAKVASLASSAGVAGNSFDDWERELVAFMRVRGYSATKPQDPSVKYSASAVERAFGRG